MRRGRDRRVERSAVARRDPARVRLAFAGDGAHRVVDRGKNDGETSGLAGRTEWSRGGGLERDDIPRRHRLDPRFDARRRATRFSQVLGCRQGPNDPVAAACGDSCAEYERLQHVRRRPFR